MQKQSKNDLVYILTILEAAEKVRIYSKNFQSSESFYEANNQLNFNASVLLIATIGEYAGKISLETMANYPFIPWSDIKNTRNRIVHDYLGIDQDVVFEIVSESLPKLIEHMTLLSRKEIIEERFLIEEVLVAKNSSWYTHVNFENLLNKD